MSLDTACLASLWIKKIVTSDIKCDPPSLKHSNSIIYIRGQFIQKFELRKVNVFLRKWFGHFKNWALSMCHMSPQKMSTDI